MGISNQRVYRRRHLRVGLAQYLWSQDVLVEAGSADFSRPELENLALK